MEQSQQEIITCSQFLSDIQQSDQDQSLAQNLEFIKNISFCTNGFQKFKQLHQIESKLQIQLEPQTIKKLHGKVYKELLTFKSFSLWYLQLNIMPGRMSLLRCVLLLSLTLNQVFQKQAEGSSKYSEIKKRHKIHDSFLQEKQNEQILEILIDKWNFYGYQMFIWRQLVYQINPKNVENTFRVANVLYELKRYQETLQVLQSIIFDHPFQAETDLLRGLAYKQLNQTVKAQYFMKQALINSKNKHPEPQKCCFQIAKLCDQLHRYAEAAYFYQICVNKNKCDIQIRLKHVLAMFNAKIYQQIQKLINQLYYLESKGFRLTFVQKAMLMILRARVLGSFQNRNEYLQIINNLYDQALNLLIQDGDQVNILNSKNNQSVQFYRSQYFYRKGEYDIARLQFQKCLKYKNFYIQVFIYLALCIISIQPLNLPMFDYYIESILHNLKNIEKQFHPSLLVNLNQLFGKIKQKKIKDYIQVMKQQSKTILRNQQKQGAQIIRAKIFFQNLSYEKIEKIKNWTERQAIKIVQQLILSYAFFRELKQYKVCLNILDRAKELYDKQQIIYIFSGKCLLKLQEYDKAEKQYRMALQRNHMSQQALKDLFTIAQRKNNQQQMLKIGQKILKGYKIFTAKKTSMEIQKIEEDFKQECIYKRKMGKILINHRDIQNAVLYMRESLRFNPVDQQYYMIGLQLYLTFNKTIEARELLEQLHNYKNREDISQEDLITSLLLVGESLKLKKYLENKEFQLKEVKQLELIVKAIIQLPTCEKQEIKQKTDFVMDYLTRLKSQKQRQRLSLFRLSAVSYRIAEILFNKQAYEAASSLYSLIPVKLHKQITEKIVQCVELANKSQSSESLKDKLQILQKGFLLTSSKLEKKQYNFSFKKYDKRLEQLLEIYEEAGELQKQNALVEQLIKDSKITPSEKMLFIQKFFELQYHRRGYEEAEKSAKNIKNVIIPFLFYLYFEKEESLAQTLRVALKQMTINPSSKMVVLFFKAKIMKNANPSTKIILDIIDQFNKTKVKSELLGSLDTFEKTKQFIQLRKQENYTKN